MTNFEKITFVIQNEAKRSEESISNRDSSFLGMTNFENKMKHFNHN